MKARERQEFIKQEIQAISDELNIYIEQINLLKPFINNLVDVANGAEPVYDLSRFTQKNK